MSVRTASQPPHHVAVIMDGNGRWAVRRNKQRLRGHYQGVQATREVVRVAAEQSICCLTLFAFSRENRYRPAKEISALFKLFIEALNEYTDELVENQIQLCFVGDLSFFPDGLRAQIKLAEKRTLGLKRMRLNIAVNYSGRWDVARAAHMLFIQPPSKEITPEQLENAIAKRLLIPEVDLLIRTGGERRISNFMLWQIAYSELFFADVLWPDFKEADMLSILDWYGRRERRFGGIKETV